MIYPVRKNCSCSMLPSNSGAAACKPPPRPLEAESPKEDRHRRKFWHEENRHHLQLNHLESLSEKSAGQVPWNPAITGSIWMQNTAQRPSKILGSTLWSCEGCRLKRRHFRS